MHDLVAYFLPIGDIGPASSHTLFLAMRLNYRKIGLALAVLTLGGCESATGLSGEGELDLVSRTTRAVSIAGTDTSTLNIVTRGGDRFSVHVETESNLVVGRFIKPPNATANVPPVPADEDLTFFVVVDSAVAGTYRLILFRSSSAPSSTPPIAVTVRLHRIDSAPEVAAAALPIGTIVNSESLDYTADVDEFAVDLPAGEEFVLAMQCGSAGATIRADLRQSTSSAIGPVLIFGARVDANFESTKSAPFTVANSGRYIVRVSGSRVSPYSLRLRRASAAP